MTNSKTHTFKAENGVTFLARRIDQDKSYGLNDCLTHGATDALVEFYDTRYPHTAYGQFVSRYYLSTLQEHALDEGLNLCGGVPDWSSDAASLQAVVNALKGA